MYDDRFAEGVMVGQNSNSGYGNGMFGDGAWWIIILLIFGYGWGGNGNFGGGNGVGSNYILATDFATIERKLDSISNGICDATFALNNTIVNGFNNTNQNIITQGYETRNAINHVSSELASCCCALQKELLENRYIDAQNTCAINTNISNVARDIIDNQRMGVGRILDFLTNEKLCTLQAENSSLKAQISNDLQTRTIVGALSPKQPIPAYPVFAPNTSFAYPSGVTFGVNNSGCGCNSCEY